MKPYRATRKPAEDSHGLPKASRLEREFVSQLLTEIREWKVVARRQAGSSILYIKGEDDPLHEGVRDGPSGHLIRALFHHLDFDENRLFRWFLQHKLVQALILSKLIPGSVPPTRGLCAVISQSHRGALRQQVETWKERGYLIKKTLITGSGEHGRVDFPREAIAALEANHCETQVDQEEYMLQKRIDVADEFRVHSVERHVVEDLTIGRYRGGFMRTAAGEANSYVQSLLNKLPDGLTNGTIHNWDVARTTGGNFVVIEINLTGYHPTYREGFQCSGFFRGVHGPAMLARLLRFFKSEYGLSVKFPIRRVGYSPDCLTLYKEIRAQERTL